MHEFYCQIMLVSHILLEWFPELSLSSIKLQRLQRPQTNSPLAAPAWVRWASRSQPGRWTPQNGLRSPPSAVPAVGPCNRPPYRLTPEAASPHWSPHPLPPYAGCCKPGRKPRDDKKEGWSEEGSKVKKIKEIIIKQKRWRNIFCKGKIEVTLIQILSYNINM